MFKALRSFATMFLAVSTISVSHAAASPIISGLAVQINEKSGEVVVTDACIEADQGRLLRAKTARFTSSRDALPESIKLEGGVVVIDGARESRTDKAIYFPSMQALEASSFTFSENATSASNQTGVVHRCQASLQATT